MFSSLPASDQNTNCQDDQSTNIHTERFVLNAHKTNNNKKTNAIYSLAVEAGPNPHTHSISLCWRWQAALLSIIHPQTRAQTRESGGEIKALPPAHCNPITGLQIWLAPQECAFSCPSLATAEQEGWREVCAGVCVFVRVSDTEQDYGFISFASKTSPLSSCANVPCMLPH